MSRGFYLGVARSCFTLWCGGAILFVWVTVQEIFSGRFESMVLDQMVLIRFPLYYLFGMGLLPLGVASLLALFKQAGATRALHLAFWLAAWGLILLLIDFFYIYRPLREMLLPIGVPRPAHFRLYHQISEITNGLILLFNTAAALILNFSSLPERPHAALDTATE